MSDKPNIEEITFGDQDEMKAKIEQMKRDIDNYIEIVQTTAKIRRASFDALVEEGFTEQQALELVKNSV